jgi:hypothetical protein
VSHHALASTHTHTHKHTHTHMHKRSHAHRYTFVEEHGIDRTTQHQTDILPSSHPTSSPFSYPSADPHPSPSSTSSHNPTAWPHATPSSDELEVKEGAGADLGGDADAELEADAGCISEPEVGEDLSEDLPVGSAAATKLPTTAAAQRNSKSEPVEAAGAGLLTRVLKHSASPERAAGAGGKAGRGLSNSLTCVAVVVAEEVVATLEFVYVPIPSAVRSAVDEARVSVGLGGSGKGRGRESRCVCVCVCVRARVCVCVCVCV